MRTSRASRHEPCSFALSGFERRTSWPAASIAIASLAVERLDTMTYAREGRIARITLDRPERGNAITLEMPRELAACVERANLDPEAHVIALAGNGSGFCGGYDLASAEGLGSGEEMPEEGRSPGSPLDPATIAANHDPNGTWDPVVDYQMMSRNVRGFMSLYWSEKPVICKVHGYCVAGGTDMALCSDLLVVEDRAKIGYPPARVWGVPTTALWAHRIGPERAKRLLLTGDSISGVRAVEWGLASESAPAAELEARFESLVERVARLPVNQLVMHKLLVNQAVASQGLAASQALGTFLDGIARHTPEGFEFQRRASEAGFKAAVRERDEPFGDLGRPGRTAQ
ncbi:MAG: crotonase/enoyl-CoA hydratase family protein [Solirubrobacterales bacterium]|nr:crotonase/enoyl-CoA hydratase family protein [Solirubrobacterales bacterium]